MAALGAAGVAFGRLAAALAAAASRGGGFPLRLALQRRELGLQLRLFVTQLLDDRGLLGAALLQRRALLGECVGRLVELVDHALALGIGPVEQRCPPDRVEGAAARKHRAEVGARAFVDLDPRAVAATAVVSACCFASATLCSSSAICASSSAACSRLANHRCAAASISLRVAAMRSFVLCALATIGTETSATMSATTRTRPHVSTVRVCDSATPMLRPRPKRRVRGLGITFDPNEASAPRWNSGVTLREVRGACGNNLLVTGSVANARIFVMRERSAGLADDEVLDTSPDSGDVEQFGAERPSVFERAIDCFEPARTVLFVCIVVWIAWFFRLPLVRHERFQTFGFDLGIYDQGVWLLSQFRDPFVTVRGLDLFGHHMNPFLLVLAPFYRGRWRRVPARGASARTSERRDRDLLARARSVAFALVRCRARDRTPAEPDVPMVDVGVLPPRRSRDRPVALRVLGCARTTMGLVHRFRGDRAELQGRRRARRSSCSDSSSRSDCEAISGGSRSGSGRCSSASSYRS